MIRALVSGVLYGESQTRTGKSGKPFTTAKVRADGKDGAAVWCSIIAFGEQAERLAALKPGAALAVSGLADVSAWSDKQGEPKAGLSLVVDELVTLKSKPRPSVERVAPAQEPQPAAPFDDFDSWEPDSGG